MLKAKKGRIMRHPYLSLAVIGLAVTGAISISNKVKGFFKHKADCVGNMLHKKEEDSE